MTPDLERLLCDSWDLYDDAGRLGCAVEPSIPIVWFGDWDAYQKSKLKIVTAAINPSADEFPDEDRFKRFPAARWSTTRTKPTDQARALNCYFEVNAYWDWFGKLEPLLAGFGATFRAKHANTALHTDVCSPIATSPKWADLGSRQARVMRSGIPHWQRLLRQLNPDVLLLSVSHAVLNRLNLLGEWSWANDRIGTKSAWSSRHRFGDKETLVVYAASTQNGPFGALSEDEKRDVGRLLGFQPLVSTAGPGAAFDLSPPSNRGPAEAGLAFSGGHGDGLPSVSKDQALERVAFEAALREWASRVRPKQEMGISIWVKDGAQRYRLNSDATREGVQRYLALVDEHQGQLAWHVGPSNTGTQSKVVFGPDRLSVTRFPLYRPGGA
jgi:hypothetical protein